MKQIKISIIIANYNNGITLERAIKSILAQTYKNYEIILIDGGSTDNSIDIIERYSKYLSYSVSEPDRGIADAWNKGLSQATGDVIGLLNADDEYYHKNFEIVAEELKQFNDHIFYGSTVFIQNYQAVSVNEKEFDSVKLLWGFGFTHTSCFIPKTIYDRVGFFNIDTKIAVDTEFLLRAYLKELPFKKINTKVYMAKGGVSDKQFFKGYREYLNLLVNFNLYSRKRVLLQLVFVFLMLPIRKLKNNILMRNLLRQLKHITVFFRNKIYSLLIPGIARYCYLRLSGITLGKQTSIIPPVKIYCRYNINIGNNTVINRNCLLDNRDKVDIGNNVSIAHNCSIYTAGHEIVSPYFELKTKPVKIMDNVVIFANVLINPGIIIAEGAVILSGSVVTKNVEPYTIVGGNPARSIGKRSKNINYKLDYNFWGAL